MSDEREQSATITVKLRVKEALRADIEAAARRKGISMNKEMVERLERPLEFRAAFTSVLGGPRTEAILHAMAIAARPNRDMRDDLWLDDYEGFQTVKRLWQHQLDTLPSPPMPDEAKKKIAAAEYAIEGIKRTKQLGGSKEAIGTACIAAHHMVSTVPMDDATRDRLNKLLVEAENYKH